MEVDCVSTYQEAADILQPRPHNILLFRFSDLPSTGDRILKVIRPSRQRTATIALLSHPSPQRIRNLVAQYGVVDVLTDHTDRERIQSALQKAVKQVTSTNERPSHYRGFFGFVAIVPSLRERKILADSGIGLIQNQSLRLAIDYWRTNPKSQMVAVAFRKKETFTTRHDELTETWAAAGILPWQVGMFEAQEHYLEYWQDPIRDGLMPALIPIVLKDGNGNGALTTIDPAIQKQILVKVGRETRSGNLEDRLRFLRIQFRPDHSDFRTRNFEEFVRAIEKQMQVVDSAYPELTRPPTETGWEGFVPDTAKPYEENNSEMVYMHNRRSA